ncbi:DMT family transporter [Acidimangrovimonas pyrenivorans]|uniref:DMT family transporter n=1 Tax=Acidimangrovimonas pyrenivorans TaxID=2030798 RepID=A0ABV7ADG7_9RHOB
MSRPVQKTLSARAWAELLLLALIWGGSFLSIRLALDEVGVLTSVAFRVGGAAVVLWVYVLGRRLPLPRRPRVWAAFLVMGLLNNVIPFSLITWGELHIASGLASILNASTAIFGVLVAALVFADERLGPRRALGVLTGFAGVATAVGPSALTGLDLTSLGQLAVLGAASSYACAAAFARASFKGVAPQVAAAGMLTGSTLVLVPAALLRDGAPSLDYSAATWGALVYLAVLASAGAYLLYYRVLAMAGAGNLSLVTLLVSPVAILLGWLVLGETLPRHAFAGFGLLALGLAITDGRLLRRRTTKARTAAEKT